MFICTSSIEYKRSLVIFQWQQWPHKQRVISLCCLQENFCETLYLCNGICYHKKLHKIKSDWISCDKILLWRQRPSQKFSSTQSIFSLQCVTQLVAWPDHKSYLLLLCVTVTCCLGCPNLWSLDSQAQLPLLLTQSCCPPTYRYVWGRAIFQHLARWQAPPFFSATLAWTWATPILKQKPCGHVLANFDRCISVVMPY